MPEQADEVRNLPNLLVMFEYPPSSLAGALIVLRSVLHGYPGRLVVITSPYGIRWTEAQEPLAEAYECHRAPWIFPGRRFVRRIAPYVNYLLVPGIVARAVAIARKTRVDAILTTPMSQFFIAAYYTSRITGLPLYVYAMDDWVDNQRRESRLRGAIAARLLPRILHHATRAWVVSEFMAEDYRSRYGVDCVLLAYSVDVGRFREGVTTSPDALPEERAVEVYYTGSITQAQIGALRDLIRALDESNANGDGPEFNLTFFTNARSRYLHVLGLDQENISVDWAPLEEMPDILSRADILFLPFSFDANQRQIVSTSFPTKLAEYLASGVPILAHAPAYSTIARYARAHDFALVVDEPDPRALLDALRKLATDAELRAELSRNALQTAKMNHDEQDAMKIFRAGLSS